MVNNLPANAGDTASVPGSGNKIPQATGRLLSLCSRAHAATREATSTRETLHVGQRPKAAKNNNKKKRKCLTVSHRLTILKIYLKALRKQ